MKKRLRIVLALAVVAAAGIFLYNFLHNRDDESILRFSGNIEVTEAQLGFRIPGRLAERLAEEGDTVREGRLLARLDKSDQEIGVAQAEANLAYAEAVLAELLAGSRQEEIERAEARVLQAKESLTELQRGSRSEEIESARAELARARAAEQSAKVLLNQARADFARYENLFKEESVSRNVFETYRNNLQTAENQVKEASAGVKAANEQLELVKTGPRAEQIARAEAALKQAEAEFSLVKAGPRQEAIDQAKAKAFAARANLLQANQQLSYTELLAPMDGVVLSTAAEPGEYLNPSTPVLTLGRLARPWLRAYVGERDLGRIKLNQEVRVTTDSFPDKSYTGRVSFIASQAEFTPKTVQTFDERVKLMYRIKVDLENPEGELKPGMPADGLIDLAARQGPEETHAAD